MTSAETIVVIGGGIAGLVAVSELRKIDREVKIILIEPKDFFEVPWSSVRGLVDADVAHASTFPLGPWAVEHDVQLVDSYVTTMDEHHINLANSRTIVDFDVVLIAVGASNPEPGLGRIAPGHGGSFEEGDRLDTIAKRGRHLLDCGSVAIVGGGLVGVEMAGELAYTAKQEETPLHVTLIHSEPRLAMADMTPGASRMAQRKLERLGVTIYLNERCNVTPDNAQAVEQHDLLLPASGIQVSVNEIVWTTGITPRNQFIDGKYKTFRGDWLKVDDFFRVLETVDRTGNESAPSDKFFAFGDCCDWWPNNGFALMQNGSTIAHNLETALLYKSEQKRKDARNGDGDRPARRQRSPAREREIKPFRSAKASPRISVTTIGAKSGVASGIGCCGHTQFLLPGMKNRTMFLRRIEKATNMDSQ